MVVWRGPAAGLLLVALLAAVPLTPRAQAQPAAAPAASATAAAGPAPAISAAEKQLEADLLLAFKASFDNGEDILPGWRAGTDTCAWDGVSCGASGFVEGL